MPTLCENRAYCQTGKPEIVVWDRNPLRPVWVLGQCRRSFLVGPKDGQGYARTGSFLIPISLGVINTRLRQIQRGTFQIGDHLQAANQVRRKPSVL